MHILGILEARMGSLALPGKGLMDLMGKSVVMRIVERLRKAALLSDLVVATTTDPADQAIFRECGRHGVKAISGTSEDTISRFHEIAHAYAADAMVRVTDATPLIDPEWTDLVVKELITGCHDYVAVADLPQGIAPECFTHQALDRCFRSSRSGLQKESVTFHFRENSHLFDVHWLRAPSFQRYPWLRLTVETEEDYRLMRDLYRRFHQPGRIISVTEIIQFLAQDGPEELPRSFVRPVVSDHGMTPLGV